MRKRKKSSNQTGAILNRSLRTPAAFFPMTVTMARRPTSLPWRIRESKQRILPSPYARRYPQHLPPKLDVPGQDFSGELAIYYGPEDWAKQALIQVSQKRCARVELYT